jgi:hypothetical protein
MDSSDDQPDEGAPAARLGSLVRLLGFKGTERHPSALEVPSQEQPRGEAHPSRRPRRAGVTGRYERYAVTTPCPGCGERQLAIEMRITAKPIGSFSIGGSQPKVVAREVPWLVCAACGIEAEGKQ